MSVQHEPRHRADAIPEATVREALTLCRLAASAIDALGTEYRTVARIADAAHDLIAERTGVQP